MPETEEIIESLKGAELYRIKWKIILGQRLSEDEIAIWDNGENYENIRRI